MFKIHDFKPFSSSIACFPFPFFGGFMDEAVVSMKLVRVEFHHTHRNYGRWYTVSLQVFD